MPAKIKSKNYIFSLIVMIVLMFLFYRSFYWTTSEIGGRKIVEAVIIIFGIVVVPIIVVTVPKLYVTVGKIIDAGINVLTYIRKNIKKVLIFVGIYVFIVGASYAIEVMLCKMMYHTEFNILRFYIVIAFNSILYALYVLRKILLTKPEVVFFVLVMIIGLTFIKVTPPLVGVSWDDQIHYDRTVFIANSLNGIAYSADNKMVAECEAISVQKTGFVRELRDDYINTLNEMYDNKQIEQLKYPDLAVHFVAYIPAAVGIIFARGMGLSYINIFQSGELFNLIFYALLMYFAIKKIKYGKIYVSVFGLLPIIVFMASTYSYDSWLIGFSVLGFAYLMSSIYESKEKKCSKDMILGIVYIAVGCLVKQVYFPLFFVAIFVAMYNYKGDKKKTAKILLLVVAASILLIFSFAAHFLWVTNSATDVRGGADVDAVAQMKYVLTNPLAYAKTLLTFLKSYLAIESMSYLTCFAYAGTGEYWGIAAFTIILVAFLDRNIKPMNYKLIRTVGIAMSFVTIAIVASSLYAAFTPVAATTIAGCSPRYIVPVLFPALYLLAPDGVELRFNKKMLIVVPMIIMTAVTLRALDVLCASLYI